MLIGFRTQRGPVFKNRLLPALRLRDASFTLLELLVVVAIVAILAGLLYPALVGAREKGRMAACLSNLRQIGTAVNLYVADNRGFYPPNYAKRKKGKTPVGSPPHWQVLIWDYLAGSPMATNDQTKPFFTRDAIGPYFSKAKLFVCPSHLAQNGSSYFAQNTVGQFIASYAMNFGDKTTTQGREYAMSWWGAAGDVDSGVLNESRTLGTTPAMAKTILLCEQKGYFVASGGCSHPALQTGGLVGGASVPDMKSFHGGTVSNTIAARFNYLFADGHAENLSPVQTVNGKTGVALKWQISPDNICGMWTVDPDD